MNINAMTKDDLEMFFLTEETLYAMVDEKKFLAQEYTVEELRAIAQQWIENDVAF
jgi:hypothetical protein